MGLEGSSWESALLQAICPSRYYRLTLLEREALLGGSWQQVGVRWRVLNCDFEGVERTVWQEAKDISHGSLHLAIYFATSGS